MSNYSCIFFDLDGTLTDPGLGITNAVMYALERFGISVAERSSLYRFIGPPLIDSFTEFYGFSDADARLAVSCYREYYADKGLFENSPYPGIAEVLARLRDSGRKLLVATSKPDGFSRQILERFDLMQYFDFLAGAAMDETRTKKSEVIDWALEHCTEVPRSEILMVGDRRHDVLGAKEFNLPCLGVLYGYGSREELNEAGAIALAETPEQVADYIL